MAMGREDWGNGNCSGNGALGQEQQEQQEAMAMGQRGNGNDRSLPLRSIDRVCVCGRVGRGRGRQHDRLLFRVFESKTLVNAKWRCGLKE
jgi:hypothetical protein